MELTPTLTATAVPAMIWDGVHLIDWELLMGWPSFPALIAEYAAETAIDGMPPYDAKVENYRKLHQAGVLHVFAAVQDGELVGFLSMLISLLPHYGVNVAVVESVFVSAAHRKGGIGLRLIAEAEKHATVMGSPGLLISTPMQGNLIKLLPKCGYTETNRVFFKKVRHGPG
jgi:GNAT superfamily N-acetyltransferase